MATSSVIDQNVDPIQPYVGRISWATADGDGGAAGPIKTANTAKDGTGTVNTVFTAGTQGSILWRIRFRSVGANIATVARIFVNNGGSNAVAANNILVDELDLPLTTATETAIKPSAEWVGTLNLPPGYKIFVTIGTTVADGWRACGVGGDY